jgi:CelD/BcsL family acetyltransferase involved in cellulose biosynthesis
MLRLLGRGAAARPVWGELIASSPHALVSQTPAWMDCVTGLGRHRDSTRLYETADGRHLVLPLATLRATPRAVAVEASMPFGWGTGGLLASGGRVFPADVAGVLADLRASGALRVDVRPGPVADPTWRAGVPADARRTPRLTQTVELDGGFQEVWDHRFSKRVRRNSRKAEKLGLSVEHDDTGRLVPVFDALYRASVDRWAQRQNEPPRLAQWRARRRDPPAKFASVADRFGPGCRVWVARRDGEPVAAIIVLSHGENATYWRGAMDDDLARGTGANELLHHLAIEHACAAGRRHYHMGDSAPGSSLADFKHGFGAEDHPHTAYRLERLPLTAAEHAARNAVKRAISFRD